MRILVLSFYYRPDLSAGSFRTTALVEALRSTLPDGAHVDVITTLPNRYSTYTVEAPEREEAPGLTITRVALPNHHSGFRDQAFAFAAFARRVARLVRGRRYDLVFATSSRLMTATLGAWISRRVRARFYADIRDIFVETIGDVLPRPAGLPARVAFSLVERWTLRRARSINLVSPGFAAYFERRYPGTRFTHFTNGIDPEFLDLPSQNGGRRRDGRPISVLYAGNIGESQGLHNILPALARQLGSRVEFTVIGDGGRRTALEAALRSAGAHTVRLLPPMTRPELLRAYRDADVLFLHLNDRPAFERVLPSKIFEYAALSKPVWAGIAGFAADFVRREVSNAAVFEPCDAAGAVRAFERLRLAGEERVEFRDKYARRAIARAMAHDILHVATAE